MKIGSHDGVQDVIGGVAFNDGWIIDLVVDGAARLAAWDGQSLSIAEKVSKLGKAYVAGELDRMASAIYSRRALRARCEVENE